MNNLLSSFGIIKVNPNDEYQKHTCVVIEEAVKLEAILKDYVEHQRVFTDALVEWTASREPGNTTLSELAKILSKINFEWTKSQEVFRESVSRIRHDFEVLLTDLTDKEYFEKQHEEAKKELEAFTKKAEKRGKDWLKKNESEASKLAAREERKRSDLKNARENRENQTMLKVKKSFKGLSRGYMHMGASSYNIYQAFQVCVESLLPEEEFGFGPIVLRPEDYLAITDGRAQSSLAIEKEISRARSRSQASSVSLHSIPSSKPTNQDAIMPEQEKPESRKTRKHRKRNKKSAVQEPPEEQKVDLIQNFPHVESSQGFAVNHEENKVSTDSEKTIKSSDSENGFIAQQNPKAADQASQSFAFHDEQNNGQLSNGRKEETAKPQKEEPASTPSQVHDESNTSPSASIRSNSEEAGFPRSPLIELPEDSQKAEIPRVEQFGNKSPPISQD